MNARIYCRVSTTEQAEEGFSISAQRRACRQFCRSQGWEIAEEYIDEGYSAKDMDRPALQRLLDDLRQDDIVVVWRLDRLTRSVLDLHTLLQRFQRDGALFRSVTEPYDTTTAIGRLFVTLVAALAQWERENLGERVREGMTEMVRQGKWHGGPRPYGYRPEDGALVIVPEEARVVREVFDWYIRGQGLRTIAATLNERGLRTTNGALWSPTPVSYMLRNPVYTGRIGFKKVKPRGTRKVRTPDLTVLSPRVHEAIIDDATFDKAQAIMEHRAVGKVRTRGHIYPLTGVLYCGKCGGRMNGFSMQETRSKTPYRRYYYICQNRRRINTCDMRMIQQEQVERAFIDRVARLADAEEIAVSQDEAPLSDTDQEAERLRRELRSLAQKKARWYDAFEAGAISLDDLKERTAALVIRESEIQQELANLETSTPDIDPKELVEAMRSLGDLWPEMEPTERKAWVHDLFERVILYETGVVEVEVKNSR